MLVKSRGVGLQREPKIFQGTCPLTLLEGSDASRLWIACFAFTCEYFLFEIFRPVFFLFLLCCSLSLAFSSPAYASVIFVSAGELCQEILHALLRLRLLRKSHLQLLLVPQITQISFAATYANTVSSQALEILSHRCKVTDCHVILFLADGMD